MRKLAWSTCLMLVFLLLLSPVSGATNNVNIIWSTFQGNAAHNGYVPIALDPSGFEPKWDRILMPDEETILPFNPIAAGDGKVFVSYDAFWYQGISLFALDSDNGDTCWSEDFNLVDIWTVNPPSYANGKVYIQTANEFVADFPSFLRAFNASNGALVFESQFDAQFDGYYAPTIYDNTVYMNGGRFGGLYAFDALSGSGAWAHEPLPMNDEWTPAVDAQYAYACVGDGLYVIDRTSGEEVFWIEGPASFASIYDGNSMRLAPVIGGQNDILVIHDGRLISFDLQQRSIRWEKGNEFTGQPSVANGMIYAIDDGTLSAFDQVTGDFLWSWQPSGEEGGAPALTGTIIITDTHAIVGSDNITYAIDLETHDAVWDYSAGGHLALGNDSLYIASSNGTLSAITIAIASDSNEPPVENELPVAVAGPDQVARDEIKLDGSQSFDPDGAIESYVWELKPRGDGGTDLTLKAYASSGTIVEGATPKVSDLDPGFYDVTLTVTDDYGNMAKDTMLLAVAEKCETVPQPNAVCDVKQFRVKKYKSWNWATASMLATIDLPALEVYNGQKVVSEMTIRLKGVLPDGGDLVLSQENKLKVKNHKRHLYLYK